MLNINWKVIPDFPNYEISKEGKVRTKYRVLKTFIQNGGYEVATLSNSELKGVKRTIHRLVSQAFIPNFEGLPQVNHKDGNKLNNNVTNLEWCSQKQNMRHAVDTGLAKYHNKMVGKRLPLRGKGIRSQYFGVYWVSKSKRWVGSISIKNKSVDQRMFKTEIEAARYRDSVVKEHKLDRPLNFPVD